MTPIRYIPGNPSSGPTLDRNPILQYSGGSFNIRANMGVDGGLTVDSSQTALIAALDADPRVQRAGGGGSEGPNVSPQSGVMPVCVMADANGNYGSRPAASIVFWIGPYPPQAPSSPADNDLWFNSNLALTV